MRVSVATTVPGRGLSQLESLNALAATRAWSVQPGLAASMPIGCFEIEKPDQADCRKIFESGLALLSLILGSDFVEGCFRKPCRGLLIIPGLQ